MSETVSISASNRLHNSSGVHESSSVPDTSDQLFPREGYVDRIAATLKQRRDSAMRDTDIAETADGLSTSNRIEIDPVVGAIIDFPDPAQVPWTVPQVSFHLLQEWEGYVTEIGEDDFTVRLLDLTAGSSYEEEEAVIPLSEISEDDLKHMRLGSIFRWVIGYERSASGNKQRVSRIVFRELPVVTKKDIAEGEEWARRVSQLWTE